MNYRKMIKRKARISVKEHYGIWVVLCLVLMIISGGRLVDYSIARTEVTARLNLPFKGKDPVSEEIYEEDPGMGSQFIAILKNLFDGNREEGRRLADERIQKQVNSSKDNKKAVLGHSRGMLSKIVNKNHIRSIYRVDCCGYFFYCWFRQCCSDHIDTGQSGDRFPGLVFVY